MFNFTLGLNVALLVILFITSPILPGELTLLGEEARQQAFKYIGVAASLFLVVSIAVFSQKWIALFNRMGERLPNWMTKDLTK